MKFHTIETLRNKLNELIEQGYKDYKVRVTYDNGYGAVGLAKNVDPQIEEPNWTDNYILFAEDEEYVKGFNGRN